MARRSSKVYDAAGRTLATIDPLGHRSTSVYDKAGQQVASIDALNNRASTAYDAAGQTVARIDPDTGSTLATSAGVAALKLTSTGQPVHVGGGGEVGVTTCQFWLRGASVSFVPEARDRITEADGTVWNIDSCERIGYGAGGTLYRCPVTLAREDAE